MAETKTQHLRDDPGERTTEVPSTEPSLARELLASAWITPEHEAYAVTQRGVAALVSQIDEEPALQRPVNPALVDALIAEIDRKLSAQVDAILHHPDFTRLESAWRSLKFLVDRTNFRENTRIQFINVDKAKLLEDFQDAPDINRSGLYKCVYTAEYGQFGGHPFGAIIGDYTFGPNAIDIELLRNISQVAAMAHAPFISGAAPEFFGLTSFERLPNLKDLSAVFEGPQYAKWNGFRDTEASRYVGLVLPRFLLRMPYGPDTSIVRSFNYTESVSSHHSNFLWGNAALAFASRLTQSFADYRWCAHVIGPQAGGAVTNLPLYVYGSMGELQPKIPTEVLISERREFELAEQGFIALTMRKNSDSAAFFSANSAKKPRYFGIGKEQREAELNDRLGTQLPYMFMISRLAHYIKVIQRENIGTWKERTDLQMALNKWIAQYVADMDNPSPAVRGRRPLRAATVEVADVPGDPGWYQVDLRVRPHFKYMGASFTLSLVGKLDKR